MISNKDKAYRKVLDDFNTLSRLTIRQMKLLSKVLTSEPNQRSESVFNQLKANENKLDQLDVKISNRIIKTDVVAQQKNGLKGCGFFFKRMILDSAMWTLKNDAMVDTMNQKTMTHMLEEEDLNDISRQKMLNFGAVKSIISRIERMAGHAAHIAEASIYAHNGEDIRHAQFPEKEEEVDDES